MPLVSSLSLTRQVLPRKREVGRNKKPTSPITKTPVTSFPASRDTLRPGTPVQRPTIIPPLTYFPDFRQLKAIFQHASHYFNSFSRPEDHSELIYLQLK